MNISQPLSIALLTLAMSACSSGSWFEGERSNGLRKAEPTGGPQVLYDVLAEGFPEIPMPNDQATRLDPTSPTGHRLNVSEQAPTEYERRTRRKFNDLDGFGTYAPITVSFNAPLNLEDIWQRHNASDDFRDDAVFVLNVDPTCKRYGEEIGLDMGRGRFPVTLFSRARVSPNPNAPHGYSVRQKDLFLRSSADPHAADNNMLFQETNEDLNQNGVLDEGEDLDFDGVLDVANFINTSACDATALRGADGNLNPNYDQAAFDQCVADNLLTWYERESNTLIMRPIWPLEQRCTYAVVLTNRLVGEDGKAIASPLAGINHRDQTKPLSAITEFLPRYDLTLNDVAFAWTFTTGSMTDDLESLRAGLYGHGPFARLNHEFPASDFHVWSKEELNGDPIPDGRETKPTPAVLAGGCAGAALSHYWYVEGEWTANRCAIEADMSAMGAMFGGSFRAPNLLVDSAGEATAKYPSDDDESWRMDWPSGQAEYGETDVTYWCSLPIEKTTCEPGNREGKPFCKPFPTILYAHGYGGSRAEVVVGHMGRTNAMGYAMCALDAYGHGLNRFDEDTIEGLLFRGKLEAELNNLGIPELSRIMTMGRDRDLNNDGNPDSGADMWTSDVFHTRDMVRQTSLETLQFVRMLRSMDGTNLDRQGMLLGDVDHDGTIDLGGPNNTVGMWGISLGGIISGVVAGAEPTINSISPNAGGAGLVDVAVRSSQQGVPQAVVLPMIGPFIEGCLPTDDNQNPLTLNESGTGCMTGETVPGDTLELAFIVTDSAREHKIYLGSVRGVQVGDSLHLRNLANNETRRVQINPWGNVRISVPSDAIRAIQRRGLLGLEDRDVLPVEVTPDQAASLGNRLTLTILDTQTNTVRSIVDTFLDEVEFQGTRYPAGTPLVAIQEGLGLERNTPEFRRFLGFAQSALGPADPAIWGTRIFMEPADASYDPNWTPGMTHVLQMPTAGDKQVPVNTGIAMGRTSGLFGSYLRDEANYSAETGWREIFQPHPDYGMPVDQLLIERYVVEGDPRLNRFPDNPVHSHVIYDIDNVSDGLATFSCGNSDWSGKNGENGCPDELRGQEIFFPVPHSLNDEPPLRLNRQRADGSYDAFRIPLLRPAGQHGIYNPQPFRAFDADAFMVNFTTRFLGTRGGAVDHLSGCDCSASGLPQFTLNDEAIYPILNRACEETDLRICDASCNAGWMIETPAVSTCVK